MRRIIPLRNIKAAWLLVFIIATAPQADAQTFIDHSRLAAGSWYRIPISQTGVYRLTVSEVPALNGANISRIALYGAPGGQLSTQLNDGQPDDLVPAAIEVVDANGNGTFDNNDYLLFYAEGPSVWRYSDGNQRFEYRHNTYATNNYYYLNADFSASATDAGLLRVKASSATSTNQGELSTFTGVAVMHDDKINPNEGGEGWMADKFTNSMRERTYELVLPGIQTGATIMARYGLASSSSQRTGFEMKYNSDARQHQLSMGDVYNTFIETFTPRTNSTIVLTCTFRPAESNAVGYIDFIELNALAPLAYPGGQWTVRNTQRLGSGNRCCFSASGSGADLKVWDVTNPAQPEALTVQNNGNGFTFIAHTEEPGTYIAFKPSDARTPTGIARIENQDLHGAEVPDLVIVTHADFSDQAERLADLHRLHDGMTVLVATQEEVFNEFSSGRKDPVSIRQLARCMQAKGESNGHSIKYLLLFGKGTYDNRNLLGSDARTVVTYQTPPTTDFAGSAYPSDDIYGLLTSASTLDISIGRLPAKNSAEARHLVDKIEGYMENKDLERSDIRGDWRNYVCLLSDDADPSSPGDTNFASSSEKTARLIKALHPQYNIDRIYADAYIQQSGVDGSYYPDVNNALRQRINYGCLLLNYIGHGSDQYIGTERYMLLSDIDRYTNTDRLTFFVTSTCSYGRYDKVDGVSGGEYFLLADAAGIGVVAAARPISHIQRFNTDVCLFALDPANTIGDALRLAKNNTPVSRCIALLGDPALRLSIPENEVVVTKINERTVDSARADSAEVLSRVTVEGEVRNTEGDLLTDFDGEVFPIVFDREVTCHTLANDNDSTEVEFKQQKNILYKGRTAVTGGRFRYSFIVPRDVSFRYDYAKLSHYAHSDIAQASGEYSNILFGGLDETVVIDEVHPHVSIYLNDSTFRNGGLTNETPTLHAYLTDSVGINAAGSGLGHDITAIIDGNSYNMVTLNDFFEPSIEDSRNGTVSYTLGKLDEGRHTLTLKCWNIFNFSGSATIEFCVVNDRNPRMANVCAAPNPASGHTTLRVEHNMGGTMKDCRIDIYNAMGALVRTFTPTPAEGSSVVAVDWDFTSDAGAGLSNGLYIMRVTATTADDEQIVETAKIIHR